MSGRGWWMLNNTVVPMGAETDSMSTTLARSCCRDQSLAHRGT